MSDVYSLSMVIVEVCLFPKNTIRADSGLLYFQLVTGRNPFYNLYDNRVAVLVSNGKRPPRPPRFEVPGMSRAVWRVAKKCWRHEADKRPEVGTVLLHLEEIVNAYGCAHDACSCSPWELVDGVPVDDKRTFPSLRQLWRAVFCK